MINKKIMMSAISIVSAMTLMGGATFAFFTDTATSNGNTFTSGTFDLQVKDNDEVFKNDVTQSFATPTGWAPGDKYVSYICFKNSGTTPIDEILLNLTSPDANSTTLDSFIYVSNIELGDVTSTPTACDAAGAVGSEGLTNFKALFDSRFGTNASLSSLITQINGTNHVDHDLIDGPAKLNQNDIYKFRVEWTFDPSATTSEAGKTVTLNIGFNANQHDTLTP
jgi:predicted ribosomally synthesized peptide with SipW-like signal peptide